MKIKYSPFLVISLALFTLSGCGRAYYEVTTVDSQGRVITERVYESGSERNARRTNEVNIAFQRAHDAWSAHLEELENLKEALHNNSYSEIPQYIQDMPTRRERDRYVSGLIREHRALEPQIEDFQ